MNPWPPIQPLSVVGELFVEHIFLLLVVEWWKSSHLAARIFGFLPPFQRQPSVAWRSLVPRRNGTNGREVAILLAERKLQLPSHQLA